MPLNQTGDRGVVMTPQFFQSVSGINLTDECPRGHRNSKLQEKIMTRRINRHERNKRAEYRGQPLTQPIAVGDNRVALLKAKHDVINNAIIDAFNKSADLKTEYELRQAIHQS
jgi:hypothetical protein